MVVFIAVIAAILFSCSQMSRNRAVEGESDKPVASEPKLTRSANGETIITVDAEAQKRLALSISPLAAMQLQPEIKGYGRVLDPSTLLAAVAQTISTQAAAAASQKEWARLKKLAEQGNASARTLETAEAAAQRDAAQAGAARGLLQAAWGGTIATREDLPAQVQLLASGETSLVRIDLPAGEILKSDPLGARLLLLADEEHPIDAGFVSAMPGVDNQTQGQGFLFFVNSRHPGLAPGATLIGYLKCSGDPRSGFLVPRDAIVRFDGKLWVYLQTGDQTFVRREIPETDPVAGGWFVAQEMKPGNRLVLSGAQMLLSEERKNQIQIGD